MTQLLVVCEGNICRSPLAKFALIQELRATRSEIRVDSAGLRALAGYPMDPDAALAAERFGIQVSEHSAQQISASLVRDSELVLTMTRRQRDSLVQKFPHALRRTFTLLELSKLLSYEPALPLSRLFMSRAYVSLTDEEDIPDPFRRDNVVHNRAAAMIVESCAVISRYLSSTAS